MESICWDRARYAPFTPFCIPPTNMYSPCLTTSPSNQYADNISQKLKTKQQKSPKVYGTTTIWMLFSHERNPDLRSVFSQSSRVQIYIRGKRALLVLQFIHAS